MALTVVSAGAPPVPALLTSWVGMAGGCPLLHYQGSWALGQGELWGLYPFLSPAFIICAALGAAGSSWWCRGKGLGLEGAGPGRDGAGQGPGL